MTTDVWRVLDEMQRPAWTFTPFVSVGPLEFGMTHAQVQTAVNGILEVGVSQGDAHGTRWAELRHAQPATGILGPAVTVYYDQSKGLAGIAVNALRGPQVTLEGIQLVAQTPSRLETRFLGHLIHGKELRYSQTADPCAPHLGLVLRAQRAGDHVLSRPVMVAQGWADGFWDTTEGPIPQREWPTFEW